MRCPRDERDLSAHITIGGPNNGKAFGPHGLGTVYTDLRMLEAAWRVLDACSTVDIPKDNRRLVERATHPERLQAIVEEGGEAWIAHQKYIFGEAYADRSLWEIVGVHRDAPFADDGFPDDIGAIKTRLGQEDHRVRLPKPLPGPFAASIDELTLPEWMLEEVPETEEATDATACEGGFRFTFGGQTFRYDRRGVVQHE